VYDKDQLYPEYVVLYNRQFAKDDPAAIERALAVPFHMELPVYWSNCHRNPNTDPFHCQYYVRKATRDILQHMVLATLDAPARAKVLRARRVENAEIWNTYVNYKTTMRSRLSTKHQAGSAGFVNANVLDGDETTGHVRTDEFLHTLYSEDAISVENIEEPLNEHMLWHGTSKEGAEAIVQHDFKIARGAAKHGKRFGEGAYFAETLNKSLDYAQEENGLKWVLLCRVTCGEYYYTEENVETDAHRKAAAGGKDSVLANPKKQGPREFIVLHEEQVYPEFILELDCRKDVVIDSTE